MFNLFVFLSFFLKIIIYVYFLVNPLPGQFFFFRQVAGMHLLFSRNGSYFLDLVASFFFPLLKWDNLYKSVANVFLLKKINRS